MLGYGCMRFTKEGGHADIDKAEKEVHGGDRCRCRTISIPHMSMPEMRRRSGRSSRAIIAGNASNLATKLPHYLIKSVEGDREDVRGGAAPLADRLY